MSRAISSIHRPIDRQTYQARHRRIEHRSHRRDSMLLAGWRVCVLTMILVAGLLCLALSYRAAFEFIAGGWRSALVLALVSLIAGTSVKWLCENRDDLVTV